MFNRATILEKRSFNNNEYDLVITFFSALINLITVMSVTAATIFVPGYDPSGIPKNLQIGHLSLSIDDCRVLYLIS